MPHPRPVRLQFDLTLDALGKGKRLSSGLSSATAIGDSLWVCHDETVSVERLARVRARSGTALHYAQHHQFLLADYVRLPVDAKSATAARPEADLEGLASADGYLWVIGSHAVRRGEPKGRSAQEALAAVAETSRAGNRYLLARIPVDVRDGEVILRRRVKEVEPASGADARSVRTAAQLPGNAKGNILTDALRRDVHVGPFLDIPSKDNGFDLEGIAAGAGGRLFIGARGPMLNGWACVIEIKAAAHRKHADRLTLEPINPGNPSNPSCALYRKHLLDLNGGSIRDLCLAGPDLLVLTGPPMRGDGLSRVVRWRNALATNAERVVSRERLEVLLTLPYDDVHDHAEGLGLMERLPNGALKLLVVYDSAANTRRVGRASIVADMFTLPAR